MTLHRRRQGWHSRRSSASYFCGNFLNQRRWATFEVNRLGRFQRIYYHHRSRNKRPELYWREQVIDNWQCYLTRYYLWPYTGGNKDVRVQQRFSCHKMKTLHDSGYCIPVPSIMSIKRNWDASVTLSQSPWCLSYLKNLHSSDYILWCKHIIVIVCALQKSKKEQHDITAIDQHGLTFLESSNDPGSHSKHKRSHIHMGSGHISLSPLNNGK